MRYLLALWALPLLLFWSWYVLSYYDIHFGYVLLSRQAHDLLFGLYGNILGIDPRTVPVAVAKACALDSAVVMLIIAWRKRASLATILR